MLGITYREGMSKRSLVSHHSSKECIIRFVISDRIVDTRIVLDDDYRRIASRRTCGDSMSEWMTR